MTNNHTARTGEKRYWLDAPHNVDKLYWGVIAICVALFFADLFYHKHPYFSVEGRFGFYGWFALISVFVLVLGAKTLRAFLLKGENFYGDDQGEKFPTNPTEGSH